MLVFRLWEVGYNVSEMNNGNEQWINLVQQTSTGWEVRRNAKIGILVTQINNAIKNSLFSALQLDQLFNRIHNTANVVRIKYHPID